MAKRTQKTTLPHASSPNQVVKALLTVAEFLSNKVERPDRETGEIRLVDTNGAVVRDYLDNNCWKANRMVENLKTQVEEIGRRAAYYERNYGSQEVKDEDLEKVAEQLEDAQFRLATAEELLRLTRKAYEEVTGKVWIPKSKAIPTTAPAVERPMTPALARLAAARASADKASKANGHA